VSDRSTADGPAHVPAPAPVEDPWRNLPLLVALVVAGLEGLLLVGAAVWSVVDMVRADFVGAAVSVALAVFMLLFVALLVLGIHALWLGRRWGRGPVLTWQLIQAAIAVSVVGIAPSWAIYPTLLASLVVGVGLLLPASVAATSRPSSSSGTVL
jgi:MFS family permease